MSKDWTVFVSDNIGEPLWVGDRITKASRYGSILWLESGIITQIDPEKKRIKYKPDNPKLRANPEETKWVSRLDLVTKVYRQRR